MSMFYTSQHSNKKPGRDDNRRTKKSKLSINLRETFSDLSNDAFVGAIQTSIFGIKISVSSTALPPTGLFFA